ncbi:MAG: DinB family protein [Planctomycetaceae bacterium]
MILHIPDTLPAPDPLQLSQIPQQTTSMLELAIAQIRFARDYTLTLLDGFPEDAWFTQPTPGCAHLAWQLGHLAMAQYGLCLFRIRGRAEGDLDLMPSTFRKRFSRGTTPDPDPARNPSPTELRQVLDRIHQQTLSELPGFSQQLLDEPVELPWTGYPTKLGCLLFCSHHEQLHAGQIGVLRRLLGLPPVR